MSEQPKTTSFMGIGQTFYGKKHFNQVDGTYSTTLWVIFIFIPIFPLGTYKVKIVKTSYSPSMNISSIRTNYEIISGERMDIGQILLTYLAGLLFTAVLVWWFYFLFTI
ncbi:MAG: hypothetical protein A2534_03780 [Candidatus Magasanikbacteria bacterium RIFOXYD2_FULL_39_9]|uniref:Uncharacterized protein n=1 Tax=Candidatus Magasanikbacteria bacterium RIFOXYD1_FULL_40_23 TaxID=1798705 RepID=A0A1F6PAJ6_9BACT|nr:MAG: hypothetical protein A2534_03780 [Candidatus Magasanikbacteria bacterium RIFOXYD2_FULL_39_9]OGH93189.1 MAG: hypothetical protein A2563_01120 [Candidatus Magasanikbacteria bacterium RIFOXYD1_FULL_40_23]